MVGTEALQRRMVGTEGRAKKRRHLVYHKTQKCAILFCAFRHLPFLSKFKLREMLTCNIVFFFLIFSDFKNVFFFAGMLRRKFYFRTACASAPSRKIQHGLSIQFTFREVGTKKLALSSSTKHQMQDLNGIPRFHIALQFFLPCYTSIEDATTP